MSSGRRIPDPTRRVVLRLLAQGESHRAVAQQLGISATVVRNIRDADRGPKLFEELQPEKAAKIVALHGLGTSQRLIAAEVGVSQATVSRAIAVHLAAPTAAPRSSPRAFAPRPLPVVDTSGRSYGLAPRRMA